MKSPDARDAQAAQFTRVDEIFWEAGHLAPGQDRDAYLDSACGHDPELRQHVERLLAAQPKAEQFLERPFVGPAASLPSPPWGRGAGGEGVTATLDDPISERPGTIIGPYKLLEQIGEGGFGVVFMAEQQAPIRRKVALKVLKPGMDTRQVTARFEAERQALALMDHPNIARVFDGGTTRPNPPAPFPEREGGESSSPSPLRGGGWGEGSGRPYFVMELVRGVPITEYCDQVRMPPCERLELFLSVCQAIQHAHQKGIIHRDMKPSNVLVTEQDGKPLVKVIDFGIAKATGPQLTEKTLFTNFAQMIGTPLYMSPEQAGMNTHDVDTRSDIYSLGVLLYELLTGTTPFDKERLKKSTYDEIRRIIREEDAPTLSNRLATTEQLPAIAAKRGLEPAKLTKLVKGELNWIVMKCLEKDRNRRYESANGLAADVGRYLNNETVLACPPSAGYRVRKLLRRHRGPVLASTFVLLALILGLIGTTWGMFRALRAEEATRTEVVEKDKARQKATEEAAIAKAVRRFLAKDLLEQAAPEENAREKNVTVEELLDRAGARIAGIHDQQPLLEAEIRSFIGEAYMALGKYSAAQPHVERSLQLFRQGLGEDDPLTIDVLNGLAMLRSEQGRYAEAESLFVSVLEARRRVLGEEHRDTISSMAKLANAYLTRGSYEKAEPLINKALEISGRTLNEEDFVALTVLEKQAILYRDRNQLTKAKEIDARIFEVRRRVSGIEDPNTLTAWSNLAMVCMDLGQFAEAESIFAQVLEIRRRVQGPEHHLTLHAMGSLAALYYHQGKFAKAEPLFKEQLEKLQKVLGPEHPETYLAMLNLATQYQRLDQPDKAEPLCVAALEGYRRIHGNEHPDTLMFLNNLGTIYHSRRDYVKAEPLYKELVETMRRVMGPEHPQTILAMFNLACQYRELQDYAKAEPLFLAALEGYRRALGKDHPNTLYAAEGLAAMYRNTGQLARAQGLFTEVMEGRRRSLGSDHPETLATCNQVGLGYWRLGEFAKAKAVFEELLAARTRVSGPDHPATVTAMHNLATQYDQLRDFGQAETYYLKALEGHRHTLGQEHADTLNTTGSLGVLNWKRGRFDEARRIFEELVATHTRLSGPDDPKTLSATFNLAVQCGALGDYGRAEAYHVKALQGRRRTLGDEHLDTITSMDDLGLLYMKQGKFVEAEPLFIEAHDLCQRVHGERNPRTLSSVNNLAMLHAQRGRHAEAAKVTEAALERYREVLGREHSDTLCCMRNLAIHLMNNDQPAKAESLLRACLEISARKEADAWTTFQAKALLGRSLQAQQRFPEAEPLLVDGFEGMKAREKQIPRSQRVYVKEAAEQLVQLYEALEHKEKVEEWRKKVAEAKAGEAKRSQVPPMVIEPRHP